VEKHCLSTKYYFRNAQELRLAVTSVNSDLYGWGREILPQLLALRRTHAEVQVDASSGYPVVEEFTCSVFLCIYMCMGAAVIAWLLL